MGVIVGVRVGEFEAVPECEGVIDGGREETEGRIGKDCQGVDVGEGVSISSRECNLILKVCVCCGRDGSDPLELLGLTTSRK